MFHTVTLEISLKPFKQTDEEYIRGVCRQVFTQWRALLKNRDTISLMLWTGDGSEILDYTGDEGREFEWCKFMGNANHPLRPDTVKKSYSLHGYKQYYIQNPPVMTYGILKTIVRCIKEEGKAAFPDANILVGETFDIGPEFAISDFKYNRHKEINVGRKYLGDCGFIDITVPLKADDYPYAGYPDGIPEGTAFGTFFGRQCSHFLPDMGFDYLWLSNGLGFSCNPWDATGKLFDGKQFYPEKLDRTRNNVFEFWKLFREECDIPLWTRGTNNSVGIDYSTDGVPLHDIYTADLDIMPPPNSPWAALNDNYGLELMGHMTRICELPGKDFMFRYYIHDPWWMNTPWYDRYGGEPMDIYLPMSIARISETGETRSAGMFNILSIDNTRGNMPDSCVNEPLPHILKAEKDAADAPGPLVWVYPMREYTTARQVETLAEMKDGDIFVCNAINAGFPLCTVVSTDNFLRHEADLYKKSVLVSPVPETKEVLDRLTELAEAGYGVIFYGSQARLDTLPQIPGAVRVSIEGEPARMLRAWEAFGYSIQHACKKGTKKPPTMTVSRCEGGMFFSIYNCNTTTETRMRFPLGAPLLMGGETELDEEGYAHYRFNRSEHRECRLFVRQNGGILSAREAAPCNAKYRRKILVEGLEDATVYFFPETDGGEDMAAVSVGNVNSDTTPKEEPGFRLVKDEERGTYLVGEHISGSYYFMMAFAEDIN